MEPALDVIHKALRGDPGARSFLERTTSIYLLDVTDAANPKTYGCWNFIHQAMNEVERFEAKFPYAGQQSDRDDGTLAAHARLLAMMALRVARRSPAKDKSLVTTCISNAADYSATVSQLQWLIDLNLELREIVMGRIAAMAFDFSFHRRVGPHGHSVFADRVVMDTFCAILAANAVASGPQAIEHFATEWIIPSSRNLPTFAVASVVLNLASEGMYRSSPAGTKDMLQQLSNPIMCIVLVPILSEAVTENSSELSSPAARHEESSHIAAMCLRALKRWCDATDLSLPQVKHVCNKADINLVGILSDALYSDSDLVVDSLAELVESTLDLCDKRVMSDGRMNQVRHILQVDELTFRTRFTPEQLKNIESKEMESIVDELVVAVGLQRFRFVERQNKGDVDVCRNLTRIAAAVSTTCNCTEGTDHYIVHRQAIPFLLKSAVHPSINVCALTLPVLNRLVAEVPGYEAEILPILQRRAITPHYLVQGSMKLAVTDLGGVTFHEFQSFREHVLTDALVACCKANTVHFMDSCTLAVEEFCTEHSSFEVSLHLEAALFCIRRVADTVTSSDRVFESGYLNRLVRALALQPPSLVSNPYTCSQMCRFLRKFSRNLSEEHGLFEASELVMSCFLSSVSTRKDNDLFGDELRDGSISLIAEAALTLKEFFCRRPQYYTNESNIASLSGKTCANHVSWSYPKITYALTCPIVPALWEATYGGGESAGNLALDDRLSLCVGMCHVLAFMSNDQKYQYIDAMLLRSMDRIEIFLRNADTQVGKQTSDLLATIADEIRILCTIARSVANAAAFSDDDMMQDDIEHSPHTRLAVVPDRIMETIRKGWLNIVHIASSYSNDSNISIALTAFLCDLLPPGGISDESSIVLMNDLCSIAGIILKAGNKKLSRFEVILGFVSELIHSYSESIEHSLLSSLQGSPILDTEKEVGRIVEQLLLETLNAVQESLGNVWDSPGEQGQGQNPSESIPMTPIKPKVYPNDCLAGVLALFTKCLDTCPMFLLHLTTAWGTERSEGIYLRRATESAAASLDDQDPEITISSILFLKTLTQFITCEHATLQNFVVDSLLGVRADCIHRLLVGSCGRFQYSVMDSVADLLFVLMHTVSNQDDLESYLVASLYDHHQHEDDYFLLGGMAKKVALSFCMNIVQQHDDNNNIGAIQMEWKTFLSNIWELHRIEDTDALPGSDQVLQFIHQYG